MGSRFISKGNTVLTIGKIVYNFLRIVYSIIMINFTRLNIPKFSSIECRR